MDFYWDNAATTAPWPELIEGSSEFEKRVFANPSSLHRAGRESNEVLTEARASIRSVLGADGYSVVFTGSGSEANNLAIRGISRSFLQDQEPVHLITTPIEHKAVLNTVRYLQKQGVEVDYLSTDGAGRIDPGELSELLRDHTRLVSVMWANNELGTLQPVDEIGKILEEHPAQFHSDTVQAAGKQPIELSNQPVDMISISAHKFHGFKGTGALVFREGMDLSPIIYGGGQEQGLRSGTPNLRGIRGFARALKRFSNQREEIRKRVRTLRDGVESGLEESLDGIRFPGNRDRRLPNIGAVGIEGADGASVVREASERGLAISTGSACDAGDVDIPSHVVRTLELEGLEPLNVIRFSFGALNDSEELEPGLERLVNAIEIVRGNP